MSDFTEERLKPQIEKSKSFVKRHPLVVSHTAVAAVAGFASYTLVNRRLQFAYEVLGKAMVDVVTAGSFIESKGLMGEFVGEYIPSLTKE